MKGAVCVFLFVFFLTGWCFGEAKQSTSVSGDGSGRVFPSAQISRQQPDAQTQSSWDLTTPEVERLIEEKLSSESALENAKIDVRTADTIVELTGIVASARQRELAGEIAKSYSGNRRIENRIQVSGL
jgi:osmotically-inducible protein OsmY